MRYIKLVAGITFLMLSGLSYAIQEPAQKSQPYWNGKDYNENAQLQLGWAESFLYKNMHFNGNESVLDIGSGDGRISSRIAQKLPHGKVLGIDNSQSMLAQANQNFQHIPNLKFMFSQAENVEFYQQMANQFDTVVSFCTLHWAKDQNAVLTGINQVLKPQGKFFLTICSDGGDPIQAIADKLIQEKKYKDYFVHFVDPVTRFNEAQYRQLVKQANLKIVSIQDNEQRDKVENKEKLTKQLKSWLPHYHYLKKTSAALADQFMSDVVNQYVNQYRPAQDGTIILYDHYLEVVGSK